MNKKAQTEETMVNLIKIAIGTLVLLSVIGVIFVNSLKNSEEIELCRTSFIAASF